MIWRRRLLIGGLTFAVMVAGAGAAAGCSGDDDAAGSETTAPPTFDDLICLVVARYSHDLAEAAEQFNDDSAAAADPAERRRMYLEAWDRVGEVNDSLETALDELPPAGTVHGPPIRVAITMALADNREEQADGVRIATELPDEAYARRTVSGGSLFNGTEKMRAKVFLALQETAARLGVDTFDGRCDAFTLIDEDSGDGGS